MLLEHHYSGRVYIPYANNTQTITTLTIDTALSFENATTCPVIPNPANVEVVDAVVEFVELTKPVELTG